MHWISNCATRYGLKGSISGELKNDNKEFNFNDNVFSGNSTASRAKDAISSLTSKVCLAATTCFNLSMESLNLSIGASAITGSLISYCRVFFAFPESVFLPKSFISEDVAFNCLDDAIATFSFAESLLLFKFVNGCLSRISEFDLVSPFD